MLHLCYIK